MSCQIHLVCGNVDRMSLNFAIGLPNAFGCHSHVLAFGEDASVPEIYPFQQPVAERVVGDSQRETHHRVKLRTLHAGHDGVHYSYEEIGLFLVESEYLRTLINVEMSFLIVILNVKFHLVNICFVDKGVGIQNGDHDCVHVDVVLQQLGSDVASAVVDVAGLGLAFARQQLMESVGH